MAKARDDAASRRPGRPRLLDAEALEIVARLAREHPHDSAADLRRRVVDELGHDISVQTLRKRLRELGFVRVIPPTPPAVIRHERREPTEPTSAASPARYGYGAEHREKAPEAPFAHALSDAEWALVKDLFDDKVRGVPRRYSRRSMVDAICYVVRGGIPWRMLPAEFAPWNLVFKTFRRWSAQKRFEVMQHRLRGMWRQREGRSAEPTTGVMDSQSVRTSAQGGVKGYDAGKKVKGRKRHLLTDSLGLLLTVCVLAADVSDRDAAERVVAAGRAIAPSLTKVYVDSAYTGASRDRIEATHAGLRLEVVRHPQNRAVGRLTGPGQQQFEFATEARAFIPLQKRWVVERTNAWNDRARRLAKDQERTVESSTAWIWFTNARMLLRRLTSREA